ncbi:MAG: hypothetical protein OXC38_08615 [Gammaproteobacteria bacterium]|nr:hypothetical protein [Gammaproteobacteria bacterium]
MSLNNDLKTAYARFFQDMGIAPDTGRLDRLPGKKFATYPYVGSKYGDARKILFVGQDIGKDPQPGRIQSFSERRASIEDKPPSRHNPHIAGTYMTALYFLKGGLGWRSHWEKIAKTGATCQMALQHWEDLLPPENPLSYCALTNDHKFVEEHRQHRSGSMDRVYLNREAERKFFMNVELKAFDPDIVIFQGAGFERKMSGLKRKGTRFYVGQHPSARGEGIREPKVLIEDILERSRRTRG